MQQNAPFRLQRPGIALALLGCLFLFLLIVAGIIMGFIPRLIPRPEAAIRIATLLQDILIFILPAIGMALVVTRLPARLLAIDRAPSLPGLCLGIATLIAAIPALNCIIAWNQSWHLPASMASVEQYFRTLEESAETATNLMMAGNSIGSLLVSILLVGVLAGFSEELFFRGALQRTISMTSAGPHAAIWITAIIFSAIHMQIFGFVPRLLLGAFFGYLLLWSQSLWLPIILHILNNTIVVLSHYLSPANHCEADLSQVTSSSSSAISSQTTTIADFGSDLSSTPQLLAVAASVILTIYLLRLLRHTLKPTH